MEEMEINELRYYLRCMKKLMEQITETPDDELAEGAANVEPFKPTYLITAVKLPTGAIELAINNDNIPAKIDYILEAYDENMHLKSNPEIVMQQLMVV
jgi:hypothetical protein